MTDTALEPDAVPAPQNLVEEVSDALGLTRTKLEAVTPAVNDLITQLKQEEDTSKDCAMVAFLVGFAAAKDGDFSPEAVEARVQIATQVLTKDA